MSDFTDYDVHLGNTGIKVSASMDIPTNSTRIKSKINKYALLRQVQTVLDGDDFAVSSCQKMHGNFANVMRSGDDAYFTGIITCKSIWLCPVCAERIICDRIGQLKDALSSGYKTAMVTVTLRHDKSDRLGDLLRSLKDAIRKLKSGRWWSNYKDRWGVVAYVSSYEITWGDVNGWHPHAHILLFLDCDQVDVDLMWSELVSKYVDIVSKLGGYASRHHSVDVSRGDDRVKDYLIKHVTVDDGLALEMSSTDTKDGRSNYSKTFWDIVYLSKYFGYAADLIKEYAHATYRLQSMIWSRGAKDVLGISDPDDDDKDDDQLVALIPRPTWSVIRTHAMQDYVLQLAVMGDDQLKEFLGSLQDKT
jgi:hypothetical protein